MDRWRVRVMFVLIGVGGSQGEELLREHEKCRSCKWECHIVQGISQP